MLKLKFSTKFKKDLKKFKHNRIILDKLEEIIQHLIDKKQLPEKNRDHELVGNNTGYRECHIAPDVLLIYKKDLAISLISLIRIGSHSELF